MTIDVYIFRHGQTDWNKERRCQGHIDIPLNDTGRREAQSLRPFIKSLNLDIVYSSDLSRARETAKLASEGLNIPIHHTPLLREAYFGKAEGHLFLELDHICGEGFLAQFKSYEDLDLRFPGGESRREAISRAHQLIQDVLQNGHRRIGLSTHGGMIRNILFSFNDGALQDFPIPNCVIYHLQFLEGDFKQGKIIGMVNQLGL